MQAVRSKWCFYMMKPLLRRRRPVVLTRPAWAAPPAPPAPICHWRCLAASIINRRDGRLSPTGISLSSSTRGEFSRHHTREEDHHGDHPGDHNGTRDIINIGDIGDPVTSINHFHLLS